MAAVPALIEALKDPNGDGRGEAGKAALLCAGGNSGAQRDEKRHGSE